MTEPVTVYLCLGSNMGDRQGNLERAIDLLSQRLMMGRNSSIYETEAWGVGEQSRYLNLVCEVFTRLASEGLLALAKGIESKMGRNGKSGAPRPIDIDILLYGEQVIETPDLVVPHPRMTERAFVLVPLDEIAPEVVHPVNSKRIKELLKDIEGAQGVFKWKEE